MERHGFYDNEFAFLELFKKDKITCLYFDFGRLRGYRGILEEINPYDNIVIEGKKIKFLGERTAIKYILYDDRMILYSNANIDNYTKHIGHFWHLIELQKEWLGYSVIEEHLNNSKDNTQKVLKYKK